MSYHALEDFVEDCIRLIAATELPAADKRRLFYALYRLQNAFDCSYTVLRCFDELAQCGFIRKLPLSQHPDCQQHADYFATQTCQDSAWLAADAAHPEQESVFALAENGEIFIFPQFGSQLWARLCADGIISEACEAAAALPLAELIEQLLQLAHAHGAEKLMKENYLLLFECWREGIPAAEALPADFNGWLDHPALLAIRRYAVEHQLLNLRSNATAFERPSLRDALYDAATPDEAAIIRFLLDLKTTPEAIAAKREKEQLNQQQTSEKNRLHRSISAGADAGSRLAFCFSQPNPPSRYRLDLVSRQRRTTTPAADIIFIARKQIPKCPSGDTAPVIAAMAAARAQQRHQRFPLQRIHREPAARAAKSMRPLLRLALRFEQIPNAVAAKTARHHRPRPRRPAPV